MAEQSLLPYIVQASCVTDLLIGLSLHVTVIVRVRLATIATATCFRPKGGSSSVYAGLTGVWVYGTPTPFATGGGVGAGAA